MPPQDPQPPKDPNPPNPPKDSKDLPNGPPAGTPDRPGGADPPPSANGGGNGNGGPSASNTGTGGPMERYPGYALLAVSLLSIAVIGVLLYLMARPGGSVISQLSEPAYARGLITFLFTLGTIVVAILLTMNAVSRRASDTGKGFQDAKEILTVLVGILGTIIGFYFGQEQSSGGNPLELATQLSAESVAEGGTVTLAAHGAGGVPPYSFEVEAGQPAVTAPPAGDSDTGWWMAQLSSTAVDEDSPVEIRVIVTDSEGSSQSRSVELLVQNAG